MPAGQKRATDPITDGCEPQCGCWELNSGPLEDQTMFLTSEPSLQPQLYYFFKLAVLVYTPLTVQRFSFLSFSPTFAVICPQYWL